MTPLIYWLATLAQPSNLMALLAIAGAAALLAGRRRLALGACGLAALGFLVFGFLPAGTLLLRTLEARIPAAPLPDRVDGILVLGGYIDTAMSHARGETEFGAAADRLIAVAALARRYPGVPVVLTGGNKFGAGYRREADLAAGVAESFGIAADRLVTERDSRTTWENAVNARALVAPQPGSVWLFVTSAAHMPRALGTFRAAGWSGLVPVPVDYRALPGMQVLTEKPDVVAGLAATDAAAREIEGLIAYRLAGRSSAFFPAP
ncbi:YdcF family protein [Pseudoxanthobacter sp.]|uniref:YdcF family protein n=1 Tax=Pseudoxanthobacter sp. TaxID=1925742 RepID=UPI002FE127D1